MIYEYLDLETGVVYNLNELKCVTTYTILLAGWLAVYCDYVNTKYEGRRERAGDVCEEVRTE